MPEQSEPDVEPKREGGIGLTRNGVYGLVATGIFLVMVIGGGLSFSMSQNARPTISGQVLTLTENEVAKNNLVKTLESSTDGQTFQVSSKARNVSETPQSNDGVFTLGPDWEALLSGKSIRVDFEARKAAENGSSTFEVIYYTMGVGNSGWKKSDLGADFRSYAFQYDVPEMKGDPDKDLLIFSADTSGQGGAMDVRGLRITILAGPNS